MEKTESERPILFENRVGASFIRTTETGTFDWLTVGSDGCLQRIVRVSANSQVKGLKV